MRNLEHSSHKVSYHINNLSVDATVYVCFECFYPYLSCIVLYVCCVNIVILHIQEMQCH